MAVSVVVPGSITTATVAPASAVSLVAEGVSVAALLARVPSLDPVTRAWDPALDLTDAVVGMFDTLRPGTLTPNTPGTFQGIKSAVGGIALGRGSSGYPRTTVLNGVPFIAGSVDYSYFAQTGLVLPSGTDPCTMVFVGAGPNTAFNQSFSLTLASTTGIRAIGTVSPGKIGSPASSNDLDSAVAYSATGNLVICQWDSATPVNQTLFADGVQIASRTRADLVGSAPTRISLLSNSSLVQTDFFGLAMVLNRVLTLAERQRLEGWAAWRYNLVAQLPDDHPFKTAPPVVVLRQVSVLRRRRPLLICG